MEVISFINYKGGVGKTTLTANIAAELAFRGSRVLVVDLDPQANLTFSFIDVDEWRTLDGASRTIKHWYDEYLNDSREVSLTNLIVTPDKVNAHIRSMSSGGRLDLISSHLELINLDLELATQYGGNSDRTIRSSFLRLFTRLKRGLEELNGEYDIVLIDCPPNFNIVTQNAIIASDLFIVPAKADFLSTLGIDQLVRHIQNLETRYNNFVNDGPGDWVQINPRLSGVIFTMITNYDSAPIQKQAGYISQVRRNGYPVFDNYIRNNNTLFAESPENGVPVVLDTEVSGVYLEIRGEIEALVDEFIAMTGVTI